MKVSEDEFSKAIKNIPCFYNSDNTSAYSPLRTTKKYKLENGKIATSNILDFSERDFYIN